MTAADGWDELLAEARGLLAEREGENPNASLGDEMTPAPGEHFMGRWRGDDGRMFTTSRGEISVYLVCDRDGNPGFLYRHAKLVEQVAAERPQVGDEVLVLRGPTREFEKDGEARKSYPYVLRRRECSDPLPGEPAELEEQTGGGTQTSGGMFGDDEDLPFRWIDTYEVP